MAVLFSFTFRSSTSCRNAKTRHTHTNKERVSEWPKRAATHLAVFCQYLPALWHAPHSLSMSLRWGPSNCPSAIHFVHGTIKVIIARRTFRSGTRRLHIIRITLLFSADARARTHSACLTAAFRSGFSFSAKRISARAPGSVKRPTDQFVCAGMK